MNESDRPRWPAYLLTLIAPGVGHAYLGRWRRGGGWFLIYVVALAFLSTRALTGALDPASPFVITALWVEDVEYVDVAFPLAVVAVSLLDVYLLRFATHGVVRPTEA